MHFRSIEYGSDDYRRECELREQVLRAPLGLSLYNEDLSAERRQLHFGLFDDEQNLAACVIAVVLSPTEAKIRQMAVSPAHQRQGLGGRIMRGVEEVLAERGCRLVTLHSRGAATGFYEKLGYAIVGGEFTEVGIPHVHMEKTLGE